MNMKWLRRRFSRDDTGTFLTSVLQSKQPIVRQHRGVGMDEAFIRNELFVPFRSTKSGGYGIGAFQTRELIRMAGGDLEVISEKDFGTTMRILLPLVLESERAVAAAAT